MASASATTGRTTVPQTRIPGATTAAIRSDRSEPAGAQKAPAIPCRLGRAMPTETEATATQAAIPDPPRGLARSAARDRPDLMGPREGTAAAAGAAVVP